MHYTIGELAINQPFSLQILISGPSVIGRVSWVRQGRYCLQLNTLEGCTLPLVPLKQ